MNFADVRVGDELLIHVDVIDVADDAPPSSDEPNPDVLLADLQALDVSSADRAARRADLIEQQHQDFLELRNLAMVAARAGNATAASAAWRSAEALAVCWPSVLGTL
ncbi:hypothetical protein [Burkholderia vietnamiensis]|uniref:hypothetical protein n=1 Tax=Burkholderia vietnamiensis TaxID=60552 RepID=UPI000B11475F|nr:hypothetical protein [Burkholderia vietnamiensis]